jgi:DNA polymerase
VRARDLIRYVRELGWTDPPDLPEAVRCVPEAAAPADTPEPPPGAVEAGGEGALGDLRAAASVCAACRLSEGRTTVVFGEGEVGAPVMFVGEGPGAEEDRTGRPFVGQAGRLLDAMIFALGFERREVYIANVVKCRPPGNRDPEPDEVAACSPYLDRQIDLVGPRVLVALGRPAAHRLTASTASMRSMRGRWTSYRGVPVLATFHPAYLLRSPLEKRSAWEDLKAVRRRLDGAG